nr:hypothetical protein DM860_009899 [Ipomoea trifida]
MATAITNMSGTPLPYPSHGRLRIRRITRVRIPRSSVALGHNCFEIHFNPLFHLTSLGSAFSFFLDRLAGLGADIIFPIAAFAFDLVRSRNWFYGVSLSVDLETVSVLEEPDFLDGEMILNEDTAAARDYYEQPFASTGHGNMGMSQQEISMLKTERLSDDDEEDGRRLLLSPSLSEDGTKVDGGDLYRSRCPAHRKQRRKTTAHQSPSTRGGRRRRCLKPPEREMHRSSTMVAVAEQVQGVVLDMDMDGHHHSRRLVDEDEQLQLNISASPDLWLAFHFLQFGVGSQSSLWLSAGLPIASAIVPPRLARD